MLLSDVNGYSLDREQRIAVLSNAQSSLIVAGAGSGKSLTIVGKIIYLVECLGINEEDILCISFTREASLNLENNIKRSSNYNINVYTFHKLAMDIIRNKKYKICDDNYLHYIVDEYFFLGIYDENFKKRVKNILHMNEIEYSVVLKSQRLINLKRIIITFINLFKTNNYKLKDFTRFNGNKDLLRMTVDIYMIYEDELRSTNEIDFNDMLIRATDYVKESCIKEYKYIIVDEYQDTSYIRLQLLKEIIKKTHSKLMCVGDDYQSIYRFNGCDLSIFLNFKKFFKHSKILKLTNTYRNSRELIKVSSCFIMKNKKQIYKKLKSNKSICKPIKIKYGNNLGELLDYVYGFHNNVLVLGRNNKDIDKHFKVKNDYFEYKNKRIKYLTVHRSKGLEEECVILINVVDDILGFPNKIIDNDIIKNVVRVKKEYPYEEERRLFYVALTRTKSDIYLLVDRNKPSVFVKELINDFSKYIEYI